MTHKTEATREEAITAAASLFEQDNPLPTAWWLAGWDSDYTRGVLEVLADTFGANVDDHDQAKEAIWAEIRAKHEELRKPWRNAKPGQVWRVKAVLAAGREEERTAVVAASGHLVFSPALILRPSSVAIIDARKVYDPEGEAY